MKTGLLAGLLIFLGSVPPGVSLAGENQVSMQDVEKLYAGMVGCPDQGKQLRSLDLSPVKEMYPVDSTPEEVRICVLTADAAVLAALIHQQARTAVVLSSLEQVKAGGLKGGELKRAGELELSLTLEHALTEHVRYFSTKTLSDRCRLQDQVRDAHSEAFTAADFLSVNEVTRELTEMYKLLHPAFLAESARGFCSEPVRNSEDQKQEIRALVKEAVEKRVDKYTRTQRLALEDLSRGANKLQEETENKLQVKIDLVLDTERQARDLISSMDFLKSRKPAVEAKKEEISELQREIRKNSGNGHIPVEFRQISNRIKGIESRAREVTSVLASTGTEACQVRELGGQILAADSLRQCLEELEKKCRIPLERQKQWAAVEAEISADLKKVLALYVRYLINQG